MSSADQAQNRHKVPRALRLRLQRVAEPNASWHDWHQLGVLLSELAESARIVGCQNWRDYHRVALETALECFTNAFQRLDRNRSEECVIKRCAVACDSAVAVARFALHSEPAEAHAMCTGAIDKLVEVIETLDRQFTLQQPCDNPAAWHKAAIAYLWLVRISHGCLALGFMGVAPLHEAQLRAWRLMALKCFEQELSITPDRASAHRGLLLSLATVGKQHKDVDATHRLQRAAQLAVRYRDAYHFVRAIGLLAFGIRSERLFRRLRDGRALRQPVPCLPVVGD